MRCKKIKLLIETFADGDITARQKSLIDEHIKDCSGCADYFNFVSKLQFTVPQTIYKPPTEIKPLIMEKISRLKIARSESFLLRYIPVTASAVLILILLSLLYLRPTKTVEVTFIFESYEAQTVALAGDFNKWSHERNFLVRENGVWKTTLRLKPSRYHYVFVVDGKRYIPDSKMPTVDDGFGNKNSIIDITNL